MCKYCICYVFNKKSIYSFNASLAGGELFGPICGGYLTKWYGFQRSASLLGFAVLICCVCYVPYLFYLDEKLARIKARK